MIMGTNQSLQKELLDRLRDDFKVNSLTLSISDTQGVTVTANPSPGSPFTVFYQRAATVTEALQLLVKRMHDERTHSIDKNEKEMRRIVAALATAYDHRTLISDTYADELHSLAKQASCAIESRRWL